MKETVLFPSAPPEFPIKWQDGCILRSFGEKIACCRFQRCRKPQGKQVVCRKFGKLDGRIKADNMLH